MPKDLEITLEPPLLQAQIQPRQEVLHPTICGYRHYQVSSVMFLTLEDHHFRGPLTILPTSSHPMLKLPRLERRFQGKALPLEVNQSLSLDMHFRAVLCTLDLGMLLLVQ